MKLVITGSRRGHPDVERWLRAWNARRGAPEQCIVGDATGVDAVAYRVARILGWNTERVAVNRDLPNPDRYHDRNQRMVDMASAGDVCLAFPSQRSRGTYDCIGRARKVGLTVHKARVCEDE